MTARLSGLGSDAVKLDAAATTAVESATATTTAKRTRAAKKL